MATKEKLLLLLEANSGEFLSGEQIAHMLGVSRTSVWKAVKALQAQGYGIQAVTNRGYCLSKDSDVLSPAAIEEALTDPMWRIHSLPSIDSTNAHVRQMAEDGIDEGYVIIAGEQTAGRGRMGRRFFSPADTGLYMSLLLRPRQFSPDQALQLTTMAASALCLALEQVTGLKPGIKWVNDIFLNGKKICGILTEAGFNLEIARLDYVVLGMGLNLYPPREGFPRNLQSIAGYLFEDPQSELTNRICVAFLNRFGDFYRNQKFMEAARIYRERSIVIGRQVLVGKTQAQVLDITDRCQLLVRLPDGNTKALSYGEVEIVNL